MAFLLDTLEMIPKSFNVITDRFSFLLHCGKKFIHGYLDVFLIEAREEPSLQIDPRIDGTQWKASELVEGYSFESPDKQSGHDGIIIYYIISLGPEVIDMLVW